MTDADPDREVIYLWPYHEWGGAQIYYFGLMKSVLDHYPVRAIMPAGSAPRLLQYLERLTVPVEFFDARMERAANSVFDRVRRRWEKVQCEWVIVRHLTKRKLGQKVLHLEIAPWSSFWLLLYLSLRSNVFVTLHTALPDVSTVRYVFWLIKFRLLNSLSGFHLLTSNRDTLESLRGFLPESSLRRIPVAYSGIDGDEIRQALAAPLDQAALRRRFELPADAFLVFALGQFIERKGCVTLLEAAASLREEQPNLFYVWVGTDELDADRRRQIDESGTLDRFRYVAASELGGDRLALLSLLRLADLFVLPSLKEGLPLALLEAMALGKACIASNVNAIPEALHDGSNGRLVPAGDPGALAEEISELVGNRALRERFAAAGQQTVREQFDERVTAETTLAYYETCWDDRG